jgi:hypothetical protein
MQKRQQALFNRNNWRKMIVSAKIIQKPFFKYLVLTQTEIYFLANKMALTNSLNKSIAFLDKTKF